MKSEGFKRHGSNSYVAEFAENEREILINLTEQIIELLAERIDHGQESTKALLQHKCLSNAGETNCR